MKTVMEKISAYIAEQAFNYGYEQEMEKDATSVQAVRNATARSIRQIRADARLLDPDIYSNTLRKEQVRKLVNDKLYQASRAISSLKSRESSMLPIHPLAGSKTLREYAKAKPINDAATQTATQLAVMREPHFPRLRIAGNARLRAGAAGGVNTQIPPTKRI